MLLLLLVNSVSGSRLELSHIFLRTQALRTFGELLTTFDNFCNNSNLDDSGISLTVFPSRNNLKSHNISLTPKVVKKVIIILEFSKASSPDCIPVVVLKNCEPELSNMLAELFNGCLKGSRFPDS